MTSERFPKAGEPGSEEGTLRDLRPGETGEKLPSGEDSYVAKVARGAGISTVGQGVGKVLAFLAQVAIAQLFGLVAFGLYSLGVAAINGAHIVSRFGMENGVVRYVAHYRTRDDASRVRGTIIQTLLVSLAVSLALSAVMFFGAPFMADWWYKDPRMETVLHGFAFVLPFFTFMSMVLWTTQGFQTVTYMAYVQHMIRPALFLVFLLVFYILGTELLGIVAAYGVSMLLGAVVGVYYLKMLFPPLFDNKVTPKFETKALFSVSIPMSVSTGAQYLNTWSAIWILGFFAAAAPVGIFQAAARTATLSTIVRFAFAGIFSPIISSLHAQGDRENLGRLYKDVSRWIFTGAFGIFLAILLLAQDVLVLGFGERAATGVYALLIVAFAQLYSASVGPTPRMLAMTDNQNLVMGATAVAALVGVAVSFTLIGLASTVEYQLVGAAVGMASAIVTENTLTLLAVRWRLGFWPYDVAWLKPLAAGIFSAGIAYLTGLLLGLQGVALILVVGAVFGVCYLACLLAFGLSDTDREFLEAFWNVAKRYLRRGSRADNRETDNG